MNKTWAQRSDEFLQISGQFKLGALVTESSHPVTANLSEVAKVDTAAALKLLFAVDADVIRKYREFVAAGRAEQIAAVVVQALRAGGRVFFTGCGSTGRLSILLDSVWRDFWQQQKASAQPPISAEAAATLSHPMGEAQTLTRPSTSAEATADKSATLSHPMGEGEDWEDRTCSVMAGGDFALIKSVEGFEDFAAFGKKQMTDLGVSARDVVFAITEGGETSFVIGTAWAGVEAGAQVYFIYNNPDEILCAQAERSRAVIQEARIEKLNLTTGPMAITGSTRMQATSIQLCVLLTVLEQVVRELTGQPPLDAASQFLAPLEAAYAGLNSPEFLQSLAALVSLEEIIYRGGGKNNYFAGRLAIDVLTDTTERSPTFCTPPFRKFDDDQAAESWAFLFVAEDWTDKAWEQILKRKPRCVEWREAEIRALVTEDHFERTRELIEKISSAGLMRYKIGSNGLRYRSLVVTDGAVAVMAAAEKPAAQAFQLQQLASARAANAHTGLLYFGPETPAALAAAAGVLTPVRVPQTDLLLDGVTRVVVKLVLNALSTCTMVRLERVLGNYMVWVVPSNLKLIDRATRYITKLTDLNYAAANRLLFEIIAYVEPRMKTDQAYPPVVRMAVLRAKEKLSNEQAEERLRADG